MAPYNFEKNMRDNLPTSEKKIEVGSNLYYRKSCSGSYSKRVVIEKAGKRFAIGDKFRFYLHLKESNGFYIATCTTEGYSVWGTWHLENEGIRSEFEKSELIRQANELILPPRWDMYTNEELKKIIEFHSELNNGRR
jgi:hypothetical protein